MKKHIKYFLSLALAFMVASPAMAFNMEDGLTKFFNEMGFVSFVTGDGWKNLVMLPALFGYQEKVRASAVAPHCLWNDSHQSPRRRTLQHRNVEQRIP